MWRVICQIGNQRDEGRFCVIGAKAVGDFAIEMRDYRKHQVCRMLRPVSAECFHNRRMVETDGSLQNEQQLLCEARPAFAQDQVVGVLNAQTRGATNQVEGIEQFLNVEKSDFPWMFLPRESRFESVCCAAMSSAGMVENDGQFAQWSPESVE